MVEKHSLLNNILELMGKVGICAEIPYTSWEWSQLPLNKIYSYTIETARAEDKDGRHLVQRNLLTWQQGVGVYFDYMDLAYASINEFLYDHVSINRVIPFVPFVLHTNKDIYS